MDANAAHYSEFQVYLTEAKNKFDQRYKAPFGDTGKIEDYKILQTLGTGSFGRVLFVRSKVDNKPYALKLLEKAHVVRTKQVKHTISEIRIMDAFDFVFLLSLQSFFKDNVYLCLVMPFVNGGEMFSHLRSQKKFSEPLTQFYASQVILVFEYMHFCGVVYRDLKPENILIDREGYLKVTDYGFCKKIDDQRTYTLCGTPEYLAPETILSQGYNKSADWWAFGVLLFEMAAGYPPFYARDPMKIYEKIVAGKYMPPNHFSKPLKDIIFNILQVDRTKRYGILKNGVKDIKGHEFFKDLNWNAILQKKVTPPFKPTTANEADATNFDFYEETPFKTSSKVLFPKEFEHI